MALISLNLNTKPERRSNPLENPAVGLGNMAALWSWISGSEPTASGELIDEGVALQIISVYSCIRIISSSIASLPLKLYTRLPKGRSEALDSPLHDILTISPNPEMSAIPFWESVVGCMALCGNSYVYIQRVSGQVEALWPMNPLKTRMLRLPTGELAYESSEGLSNGKTRIYQASDILHFKLFSWDGLLGMSPIHLAKQSLGLTRAAEKTGARLFANNGRPAAVMTMEAGSNSDDKMLLNVRESWQAAQSGENQFKTAFLPGNWKYTPLSLDMEAVEFLKTRQFQRSEIASLFGVPAHMIGDTTRQSNTNNEQEALTLVTFTLRPYISKIENEIQRVLLPSIGRNANKFFVEFDVRELLRGDFESTQTGFSVGRQGGWLNANQILEQLGENPIPNGPDGKSIGDIYWAPVNMMNADRLLDPPAAPTPTSTTTDPTATPGQAEQPTEPTEKPADTSEPTQDMRSIVQRANSLTLVFRDAMGRLLNRDKKDLGTVSAIFEPCLRSITALSITDATHKIGCEWRNDAETDKIVAEVCKGIERRSATWTAENVEVIAGEEFRKALRSIVSGVYRELGANSVVGE